MINSRKSTRKGLWLVWVTGVPATLTLIIQACRTIEAICDMLKHFAR